MTLKGEKESHRRGTDTPVFSAADGRTRIGRAITRLLFGAFTPFVWFFHAASRRGERDEDVRRAEGEATREKKRASEKEGERGRETHVRATTMYFGAALHTPRGGQCPSLLRLKEGAEGREGWREQGRGEGRGRFAVEREVGRQGGGHRRGVEKNEQTSSERWRGRVAEERPGAHSLFFPLFSLFLSSLPFLFLLLSLSLVVTLSRLSLSFASRCIAGCSGGILTPRTISS